MGLRELVAENSRSAATAGILLVLIAAAAILYESLHTSPRPPQDFTLEDRDEDRHEDRRGELGADSPAPATGPAARQPAPRN